MAVSLLFTLAKEDNPAFDPVIKSLESIKDFDSVVPAENPSLLAAFLGQEALADVSKFSNDIYTYDGSLPNPPCTRKVQWTVHAGASSISSNQLKKLRELTDENGKSLAGGSRAVQSMSFKVKKGKKLITKSRTIYKADFENFKQWGDRPAYWKEKEAPAEDAPGDDGQGDDGQGSSDDGDGGVEI